MANRCTPRLGDLANGELLDRAYERLCRSRRNYPANSDIWKFRRRWREESLGCPLSPLMGAFFLRELDGKLTATVLFYVRFMADVLALETARWKLRRSMSLVNRVLGSLGLEKHPDKTFIGRVEHGFDFLGFQFGAVGTLGRPGHAATFVRPSAPAL